MTSNDPEGMRAAGRQFEATLHDVSGIMRKLREDLGHLRSRWTGQAAVVFEQTMTEWGYSFDKIIRELDEMADRLIGGAGHVEEAEEFAIQQGSFFKPAAK